MVDEPTPLGITEHLEAAVCYIEAGQSKLASDHLEAVLSQNPNNGDAWLCAAVVDLVPEHRFESLEAIQVEEALKTADKAIRLGVTVELLQRVASWVLSEALARAERGDESRAVRFLTFAYGLRPSAEISSTLSLVWRAYLARRVRALDNRHPLFAMEDAPELVALSIKLLREHPEWPLQIPPRGMEQVKAAFEYENSQTALLASIHLRPKRGVIIMIVVAIIEVFVGPELSCPWFIFNTVAFTVAFSECFLASGPLRYLISLLFGAVASLLLTPCLLVIGALIFHR